MAEGRWQRVEEIFKAAIELPPTQQTPFLDESCGDDDELRQTVERLLNSDRQAGGFLEEALLGGIELVEGAPQKGEETIGPYRLIEQTGSGGMGAVYKAARDDSEYEQIVAIKVIHTGMGSPLAVERFRRERQILAGLEHPNIARLLDGGTTEAGLPYLVMEYIEGESIDRYCDRFKLSLHARLVLFITVCNAVSSAHQNLVVHRDLKPSNILVTTDGTVKLLDFGIAKLLSPEEGDLHSEATLTLERALTPSYASPEQIRGELVTTASDVYSLGVLLFELIAGRRPFDLSDITRREAERRILEDPAPAPSSTLIVRRADHEEEPKAKKSRQEIAHERGLRPEALRRSLVGDLDTIVLTALRKDRSNRYPSVDKLAQDVRHHLDGMPIDARPPTFSYRATKFIRRNRVAVAVAVAFLLLTGAFGLIVAHFANQTRAEEARSREVMALLAETILPENPNLVGDAQETFRERIEAAATKVEREFSAQPSLQADMQVELVDSYLSLGLMEEAKTLAEKAVATLTSLVGPDNPRLSRGYQRLGIVYSRLGDSERSEVLLRRALGVYRSSRTQDLTHVAAINNDIGVALRAQGQWEEAEPYFRKALELYREAPSDQRQWIAITLGNLGNLLGRLNRNEDGERLLREALAIDQELSNRKPSTAVAADHSLLGFLLLDEPDLAAATEHHRLALEIRRQLLRPDHPDILESINNLASAYSQLRQLEKAIPLYREAQAIWRARPDRNHPDYVSLLTNLGLALQRLGKLSEAAKPLREAVRLGQQLELRSPDFVKTLINSATLYYETNDQERALDLYRQAAEVEATERPESANHALALAGLGASHRASGNLRAAIPPLRQALAIARRGFGDNSPATAYFAIALARVLAPTGSVQEADGLLQKAVALRRQSEPGQPNLGKALTFLGDHQTRYGDAVEAESTAREAVTILEASATEADPRLPNARNVLGANLVAQGKIQEGEALLSRSIEQLTRLRGPNHPDTQEARSRAASVYLSQGRASKAAAYQDR